MRFGPWDVECLPADGARLGALRFEGQDLLTGRPTTFRPPSSDYGRYETRRVYGYDDCFPTVDGCVYPGSRTFQVPDHGELCWLGWHVAAGDGRLDCRVASELLPVVFRRSMIFDDSSLRWQFEVANAGDERVRFLHVMHALMAPDRIVGLKLPAFAEAYDEMNDTALGAETPEEIAEGLLACGPRTARMLLLRRVAAGRVTLVLRNGLRLQIEFPPDLFGTLGIWWNRAGYPDEDGRRRVECALEPIPGTCSSLAGSVADGACLSVEPKGRLEWTIVWEMSR